MPYNTRNAVQLEVCQVCNRLADNSELRHPVAAGYESIWACSAHPEMFIMGYVEFQRENLGPVFPEEQVYRRDEPIGADISLYEVP